MKMHKGLAGVAATVGMAWALATQGSAISAFTVTGPVTGLPGHGQIIVNGQSYPIRPHSPAASEVGSLSEGEMVDLTLSGPPGSPKTQVVNIHVHSN